MGCWSSCWIPRSANVWQAVPAPHCGQGCETVCLPAQTSIRNSEARCSTQPVSGSSPSVSAQGFLSTSQPPSSGITRQGPPISLPMGSTQQASVVRKNGRSLIRSGCLQSWRCDPQTYPRPASHRGRSGGGMTACIFLRREGWSKCRHWYLGSVKNNAEGV